MNKDNRHPGCGCIIVGCKKLDIIGGYDGYCYHQDTNLNKLNVQNPEKMNTANIKCASDVLIKEIDDILRAGVTKHGSKYLAGLLSRCRSALAIEATTSKEPTDWDHITNQKEQS